jgi:hypothetical protein
LSGQLEQKTEAKGIKESPDIGMKEEHREDSLRHGAGRRPAEHGTRYKRQDTKARGREKLDVRSLTLDVGRKTLDGRRRDRGS